MLTISPAPKMSPAAVQFTVAARHFDSATNQLANAHSGKVFGTPDAKPYISGMQKEFSGAADALTGATQSLSAIQAKALEENSVIRATLDSGGQYARREADGQGLIARYNTPGDSLFGGTTAVSFALFLDNVADQARTAATLVDSTAGTSLAVPPAANKAAAHLEANPGATREEVRDALTSGTSLAVPQATRDAAAALASA